MLRTYLELVAELPWSNKSAEDIPVDVKKAREVKWAQSVESRNILFAAYRATSHLKK